jgi:hypothetical protein
MTGIVVIEMRVGPIMYILNWQTNLGYVDLTKAVRRLPH